MKADGRLSADDPVRVLGIAGSLRRASYNRGLLRAAVRLSPAQLDLTIWDRLKLLPPFDEDDEHDPAAAVLELRAAIAASDALLVVTPEYNGSLPGQLKNALDWASRPRAESVLHGKPAAVLGASPSRSGGRSAQADTRRVLARAGARVSERELGVAHAHERFGPDGELNDDGLRRELVELLTELYDELAAVSAAIDIRT